MADSRNDLKKSFFITGLIAGLLLVMVNSAVWANRYLFDTNRFTTTAVTSLTSESTTNALASEISDRALADYPKLNGLIGDRTTQLISGLLGSEGLESVLTKTISRLQVFLTSPQREPVVINLEGAKETITRLIEISGREDQTRIDVNKIPSSVTLLDPSDYPNFYSASVTLTWLAPVAFLGAVALLAWPYFKHRSMYRKLLIIQGACVVFAGLLAMVLGPLFRPPLLSNIHSPNMRVVVGNLYDAFISTFNSQTMILVVIGAAAVIGGTVAIVLKNKQVR